MIRLEETATAMVTPRRQPLETGPAFVLALEHLAPSPTWFCATRAVAITGGRLWTSLLGALRQHSPTTLFRTTRTRRWESAERIPTSRSPIARLHGMRRRFGWTP